MSESGQANVDGSLAANAQAPTSVRVARGLFLVNAVIWILLGVATLMRMAGGSTSLGSAAWIISILMFANACVMLWVGVGIGKQQRRFYYLALAVLAVNIVLTVTDQVGLLDWITLCLDVALFALLVATRARYLPSR